jgi:hypothetical protein
MVETLYEEIRQRNLDRWGKDRFRVARRLGRDLHAETADILAELVQNAEDAGATTLSLRLLDGGLLVCNDGRPFNEQDIRAISGLFVSSKDAAATGYFGIGFKAVLTMTDSPYILSGPYRFRLEQGLDPHPVNSEDFNLPPEAQEVYESLGDRGVVFWLPRRAESLQRPASNPVEPDQDVGELGEFLLFLEQLNRIELNGKSWVARRQTWPGEGKGVILRYPEGTERNYWVRTWEVAIPDDVIEKIVREMDDEEQKGRWRKGPREVILGVALGLSQEKKPQPIEVGRIFVRLPTGQQTGLPFHLQGRLALSLDRKRVKEDSPLSRWTLEVLADRIRQLPTSLKAGGLLPSAWHAFPKKGEGEKPFDGIAKALLETLEAGDFFYGDDEQACGRGQVRLAHRDDLYDLLGSEDLGEVVGAPGVRWVHPELRHGRAAEVHRSLDVAEVSRNDVLRWLQTKDNPDWWEKREEEWLQNLYSYLQAVRPTQDNLRNIPLVRLRDGRHVRPGEAVLSPEDPTEIPGELREELDGLPVVAEAPAQKHRSLLRDLGVKDFDVKLLLDRLLRRFYGGDARPDASANLSHVRLLFRLRERIDPDTLRQWGREIPFLRDREGRYVKPCEAYLPAELGGFPEVEAFFAIAGGKPFVTPTYREKDESENDEKNDWRQFLESLGVAQLPRAVPCISDWYEYWLPQAAQDWCKDREVHISTSETSTRGWVGVDWWIDGMEEVLKALEERPLIPAEAKSLWVVGKILSARQEWLNNRLGYSLSLSPAEAAMLWFYYLTHSQKGRALWVQRLRELPWLPDETGQPRRPGELFSPELKEVLGSSEVGAFLHPGIPLKDSREWARILGLRFTADPADVCHSLQERLARGVGLEEVRAVYKWLQEKAEHENARVIIRTQFEQAPLILIPDRGQYRLGEVCWEDPTGALPALKPHWSEFHRLFREFLEVPDRPTPGAVAQHLLNLLAQKAASEALVRVAREVERLWPELPEEVRRRLKEARWPGKLREQVVWYRPSQLCLRDDPSTAQWFEERIPWWSLAGLEELAKHLGVGRISEAVSETHPSGFQQVDKERTQCLRSLWDALCWMVRGQGVELPAEPPEVYRVELLLVFFFWKGIESRHDNSRKAALSKEKRSLYVVKDADQRDIGDALEEGFRVPHLREFLKDLWEVEAPGGWGRVLEWWRKKLGIQENFPPYPAEPKKEAVDEQGLATTQTAGQPGEHVSPPPEPPDKHRDVSVTDRDPARATHDSQKTTEGSIEPSGPDSQPRRLERVRRGHPEPGAPAPALIAYKAVRRAIRWLEDQGYEVKDVSGYGLGYDLEARKDNDIRYVEVKGRGQMGPVVLTKNEWRVAKEKGSQYWLFIYVQEQDQAWHVEDPASRLGFKKQIRQVVKYTVIGWDGKANLLQSGLGDEIV